MSIEIRIKCLPEWWLPSGGAITLNAIFVGIMNEASYADYQEILDETSMQIAGGDIGNVAKAGLLLISTVTTGGLSGESSEAAVVFGVLIFLIICDI